MKAHFLATLLAVFASDVMATPSEVRVALDLLRGVEATNGKQQLEAYNARFDRAWKIIEGQKPASLPIVRTELAAALAGQKYDQFFLLDCAFFLAEGDMEASRQQVYSALESIDPNAPVIRANAKELFQLTMDLGKSGQQLERYLAQADRLYLTNEDEITFFSAPHFVRLRPDDILGMVYGVAGPAGGRHLCTLAAKPGPDQPRLLQLLDVSCSEEDVPQIAAVLEQATSYAVTSPAITALMLIGGPSGRDAVLAYNPAKADAETRAYVDRIRSAVAAIGSSYFEAKLSEVVGSNHLSDSHVQEALNLMEERDGEDETTAPVDIFRANLDTRKMLNQMLRIRARSFRRETNHVFEDLPVTNLLINALQFRLAAGK
jgi:hypothetical protein